MTALERHNLTQINALNQRGGRMLSVVDLLEAGTMNLDMAGFLCARVAAGVGFLTGAVPGGAGKTTVMAALLAFLPPGIEIVTVDGESVIAQATPASQGRPACYLAHEIGSGHWYGYLWGRLARDYLRLARRGHMVVSNLHADTLPQLRDILLSPPIAAQEGDLSALGFTLFMTAQRDGADVRRRVSAVHSGASTNAPALFRWDRRSDAFHGQADPAGAADPAGRASMRDFLAGLLEGGVHRIEEVRAGYLRHLAGATDGRDPSPDG